MSFYIIAHAVFDLALRIVVLHFAQMQNGRLISTVLLYDKGENDERIYGAQSLSTTASH